MHILLHIPSLLNLRRQVLKLTAGIRREALEQMIRSIIDERIANGQLLAGGVETPSIQMQEDLNVDIAAMISNLELFDG